MHGYEDGFHYGTVEVLSQDPSSAKFKPPDGHKAYKDAFGDREDFLQGYSAGFAAGRSDAAERGFRAYDQMQAIARGLDAYKKESATRFDQGLEAGYLRQRAGKTDESASCGGEQATQQEAFCAGLRRGQLLAGPAPGASEVATTGGVTGTATAVAKKTAATVESDAGTVPAAPTPGRDGGETPPQLQPF
jgi:hypothetical protein